MALAGRLADLIADAPQLRLWRRPVTGVVNRRPRRHPAERVRARLHDAWVSTASIDGEVWFRSVAANPRADPQRGVHALLQALDSP